MKKITNKKKKLNYIRRKNYVRKFNVLDYFYKVSTSLPADYFLDTGEIDEAVKDINKEFNLDVSLLKIQVVILDDDFIRDLVTVNFKLKRFVK